MCIYYVTMKNKLFMKNEFESNNLRTETVVAYHKAQWNGRQM